MMFLFFAIVLSYVELATILLLVVFLFLGFKMIESNWSFRISKPYQWEKAAKNGLISPVLKKEERFYRDKVRFYTFWLQIERLRNEATAGAFAEVGVYKGETARIIHAMDPSRKFHLFDTFVGFAAVDLKLDTIREENRAVDFSDTSLENVSLLVAGNKNVIFHKGYFPETANDLDELFAFVHLDADLYLPTLSALKYFYPRLVRGGVIMIHDYNHTWDGAKKAVDEFLQTIPESITPIADWQGSVIIAKSR